MKRKAKNKIFTAWLLLMTLMPLFTVKAFHHHEHDKADTCHSQDKHSPNSPDHCLICNFILSPFTPGEILQFDFMIPVTEYEPGINIDKICQPKSYQYHLRAPPFC